MAPFALLSVSNKNGLVPFAKALHEDYGYKLLSSGGTSEILEKAGLPVTRVSAYTGFPEILDGRVKTLHPKIHGGILAKNNSASHRSDLNAYDIPPINLVIVNLYPFKETINKPSATWDEAIENIDIGGPAMIRAAAKNHADVAVLTNPDQYEDFLKALNDGNGAVKENLRRKLALKAFEHTASYDIAISQWIGAATQENYQWIESIPLQQKLRYGENPHQKASWYSNNQEGWGGAVQLQGKELSANNLLDLDAALSTVCEFGYGENGLNPSKAKAVVIVKHTNPCGVAIDNNLHSALKRALDADPVSAFGGIIAINEIVDQDSAHELAELFIECVVAPAFSLEAKEILFKKKNLRLLELTPESIQKASNYQVRSILGGALIQDKDNKAINEQKWEVVTEIKPNPQEKEDISFSWRVIRHVHSNAILIAKNGQTLGVGAGQMNRVGAAELALKSAGKKAKGSVLASDGFLPFNDTVKLAAEHGITSIIQPGGSIKDNDSIEECNRHGISMTFTGQRHFLH